MLPIVFALWVAVLGAVVAWSGSDDHGLRYGLAVAAGVLLMCWLVVLVADRLLA